MTRRGRSEPGSSCRRGWSCLWACSGVRKKGYKALSGHRNKCIKDIIIDGIQITPRARMTIRYLECD